MFYDSVCVCVCVREREREREMPGLTAAKVASRRLNFGNRKHKLTLKHIRQIHVCTALCYLQVRDVSEMETVTLSACSQLQRNCMCLYLLQFCCCLEGIPYVFICDDEP